MKILYLCSLFSPHRGGIETMVEEMAGRWKEKNGQAVILTKKYPDSLSGFEIINNIPVIRFPLAKNKKEFRDLGRFLRKNEKEVKSDIIHVVGLRRPMPLIGWYLAKKWNARLIGTVCGGEVPLIGDSESEKVWQSGKYTVRPFLKNFHQLAACSDFLNKTLRSKINNPSSVKTLYAGVDCSIYPNFPKKSWNRPYIFSLRRLVRSKGVDVLIKSFIKAGKKMAGVDLLIAGVGPEEKKLRRLAIDKRIAGRVFFLGDLNLRESVGYLKGAFCTVIPSRSEGGSLVNIEAMAVGCPVIASRVGGIPEYVGPGGLFFEKENEEQLAGRLIQFWHDDLLRQKLIKKGRVFARGFDWKKIFPQYERLYCRKAIKNSKINSNKNFPQKTKNILNWINDKYEY